MNPVPLLTTGALSRFPSVRHGFTTRAGGVSTGALASLNLGRRDDETPGHLVENWTRVAYALDPSLGASRVAVLSQVHGDEVLVVGHPQGPLNVVGEADGAVTTATDVILAVRVADCVPVLFAAPGGVAVAHAGWRGVAAGVAPKTARVLADVTACRRSEVTAIIGPHISGERFEVGEEVVDALIAAGLDAGTFVVKRAPKPYVDLRRAVTRQLEALGVVVEHVYGCTIDDERFFSHRRGGPKTGRFAGVIVRRS